MLSILTEKEFKLQSLNQGNVISKISFHRPNQEVWLSFKSGNVARAFEKWLKEEGQEVFEKWLRS